MTRTAVPAGAFPPRPSRGALAMLRGIGKVIHRGLLVVLVLGVVTAKALGLTIPPSLLLRADYTVR